MPRRGAQEIRIVCTVEGDVTVYSTIRTNFTLKIRLDAYFVRHIYARRTVSGPCH